MKLLYWCRLMRTRLRGLLCKRSVERELEEELRFHLRMRAAEHARRGLTSVEAAQDCAAHSSSRRSPPRLCCSRAQAY